MHANEVETSAALVQRLLAAQFPRWAGLPVAPFPSAGTDNAIYRLGAELAVRLPRIASAAGQADREWAWLPGFAPHLPLQIPLPLARGAPGAGYPWPWVVCRWLVGENPAVEALEDPRLAALDLAGFVAALQRVNARDGPPAGPHNAYRGEPLAERDARTRAAIAVLADTVDAARATAVWKAALSAPAWQGEPVWVHGDLLPVNLLARNGRLTAVLDFGCLGIGDPAVDVMAAWTCLPAGARQVFREALLVDEATWVRGRGWALSFGLIALPYYRETNPVLAGVARRAIDAALADFDAAGF